MYLLDNLSNDARQKLKWISPDNNEVELTLEYRENSLCWYLGIKYGEDVNYQNIRITTNYNLLRAYSSYLPFGMMVETLDGLEPMAKDDFSSGYCSIYMLTSSEVNTVEGDYYEKV